jgi:hypothetical protein
MATVRQELAQGSFYEEQASREVQSYIEKVEKKSEVVTDNSQTVVLPKMGNQVQTQVGDDMGMIVAKSVQGQGKAKIVLPLTEEELRNGLHHKVVDGVRWLAEWCRMMIKKYPGRVFYPVSVQQWQ